MEQISWFKQNLVAIIAVVLTCGSLIYGRIESNTKISYDVQKVMKYEEERQLLRDRLTKTESEVTALKGFSLGYNKRLDILEATQNTMHTEQKVTNEAMKSMAEASKELSNSVKELTKVVERVAVLEERVRIVEDDNRNRLPPYRIKE